MSSAPRPPFVPSQQMRPQMGAPAPGSPSPRQPMNQGQPMNTQQRQMAPQLRRVDSQGNVLPNPGQPPRGGIQQQVRPPSSGGTTSPPGQGGPGPGPRPQGAFPWAGPPNSQQNRPSNAFGNQPPNQGGRPFPRPGPGGTGGGGQPQFRPPYQQQNMQQQYQGMPQQFPPQVQQRPFAPQQNAPMSKTNSHDDDDSDVVFGQAITPVRTGVAPPPQPTVKTNQVIDDLKTIPEVQPNKENNTNPKNTSFSDLNDKKNLNEIEKEASTERKRTEELKVNEQALGSSESSSNSAKLTNFQKISGDTPENTNKLEKPTKVENNKKLEGSPKEATFNKDIKGDNDSGVDESTQEKDRNGPTSPSSPAKTPTKPTSGISRPPSATPSNKSNKSRSASRSRLALKTPEPESAKKVPMNKIQVGNAPSPNLKAVRSKIGSLDNATYKPGGGKIKIESKKIEIKAAPRIEAKNEKYTPKGGDKKIVSTKLQWNAKSKIGSLENANHKPGGGDKKIDTIKADFKDKAKPKVGSKDNVKYAPGGGDIKIQTHKLEIKAQSKIGSLDNVKHKPGGGDKKIFDDKDYLKNVDHPVALTSPSQLCNGHLCASIHIEIGHCSRFNNFWKAPKITRATTLTSSMSLPAECLVLSVSMPSLNNEKRPKSAGPKSARKPGQAIHPKPFRLF
ncbi:microtubule-associated protein tau isoform X2 [Eupeodes corollae]|uniref:microtubule-associated protein tau isoform X2 n=1 Tax=Eupeodes corollae TaxID=290404 RepID=UPI002493070A|nr:microtubule-associated protein tau isoform X2 [Eupeodes corollae]